MCDVCGTFNLKENTYCTHCGNKLIIEHVCPFCGESNVDNANHCVKCQKQINPIAIDDFDILHNGWPSQNYSLHRRDIHVPASFYFRNGCSNCFP